MTMWKQYKYILTIKEKVAQVKKNVNYSPNDVSLNYDDLCIHPNLYLPNGYKFITFDTINGVRNPLDHFIGYCD